jgi:alkanesulfonate monooxygenase SsuD/methylene tetrahydromethanopterin reductase-like flavin-dependent oxidoreductase (luciferase family)
MTDEYLRAMQELWRDPDPSFAGSTRSLADRFAPRPVQRAALRSGWGHSRGRPAPGRGVRRRVASHQSLARRAPRGRDQLDRLARSAGRPQPPAIALRNDIRIPRRGRPPASTHAGRVLAGEPAALVAQIRELADCGVEQLVLEFLAEDGPALRQQLGVFARGPAGVQLRLRRPWSR